MDTLLRFKKEYDANMPLDESLPALTSAYPRRYRSMGLKDLCTDMFHTMKNLRTTRLLSADFSLLPRPDMSPTEAYENLVRGRVERLSLDAMAGRAVAVGVVPYPPGIPLLMPGENAGPADGPLLGYLKALEAFDAKFPGFAHDTHGVENEDGRYSISCLKRSSRLPALPDTRLRFRFDGKTGPGIVFFGRFLPDWTVLRYCVLLNTRSTWSDYTATGARHIHAHYAQRTFVFAVQGLGLCGAGTARRDQ